eukprot:15108729-Alexandrium_andersonii.AAC.1
MQSIRPVAWTAGAPPKLLAFRHVLLPGSRACSRQWREAPVGLQPSVMGGPSISARRMSCLAVHYNRVLLVSAVCRRLAAISLADLAPGSLHGPLKTCSQGWAAGQPGRQRGSSAASS